MIVLKNTVFMLQIVQIALFISNHIVCAVGGQKRTQRAESLDPSSSEHRMWTWKIDFRVLLLKYLLPWYTCSGG